MQGQGKKDMQAELHKMGYELEFIDKSFLSDHSEEPEEDEED